MEKLVDRVHNQTKSLTLASGVGEVYFRCPFDVHELKVKCYFDNTNALVQDGVPRFLYSNLVNDVVGVNQCSNSVTVVNNVSEYRFTFSQAKQFAGDYRFEIRNPNNSTLSVNANVVVSVEFIGKPFKVSAQ